MKYNQSKKLDEMRQGVLEIIIESLGNNNPEWWKKIFFKKAFEMKRK